MNEKRLVQWYAADGGVDLDIAERCLYNLSLPYSCFVLR